MRIPIFLSCICIVYWDKDCFLFLLKTASESQIKELLLSIDRTPNDALEDWLPSQDEFDQFARRFSERRSTWTLSTSDNSGGKTKNTR